MKGVECMEFDIFFQELHKLIEQIYPKMIGHYVPVIALIQDSPDLNLEPEYKARLLIDNSIEFLSSSFEHSFYWKQPEDFLSAKLLKKTLDELPKNANKSIKNLLKEQKEIFHQLENPSYFLNRAQEAGLPTDDIGSSFFCMSQPSGTVSIFRKLLEQGVPSQEIQKRYLHYEAQCFICELFGIQNLKAEFPFTTFPPIDHKKNLPMAYRKTLASALFAALLKKHYPVSKQHVILRSDVSPFKYPHGFLQLFIIVDSHFCQSNPNLIHPTFSMQENSFLQQVIQVLFQKWQDIYYYGLYASDSTYIMDTEAIILLAVRDMTEGHKLPIYTLFNQISATRYEGNVCHGVLAFSTDEIPEDLIAFAEPIPFEPENIRYIRKLLEMTVGSFENGYALFVNILDQFHHKILGLIPQSICNNLYTVKFYGLLNWTLWKKDTEILSYQEGSYLYRQIDIQSNLKRLYDFLSCTSKNINTIHCIVKTIQDQKHGAMVIIFRNTTDAEDEVARLTKFHYGIMLKEVKPFTETEQEKNLLLNLSAIDGALFMDLTGSIFGFGIIVDGEVSVTGNPCRGARYNSAQNYVSCCKQKNILCVALVISEDRSLDILIP